MADEKFEHKPPAFLLYVRDWLSSTRAMAPDIKGHYIDLLAWSWDNGPVPLDADARARVLGVARAEADRVWTVLVEKWQRDEFGRGFINRRLEEQRKLLRAQTEHARAAARSRWRPGQLRIKGA